MEKEMFYAELQKQLEEIFGSEDCGAFWIEDGNKLCKGIYLDYNKTPFYFDKNYLVIVCRKGKYKVELRNEIGTWSHSSYNLLKKEWCDSIKVLDNYYLLICQNGRYGVIDIKGNVVVPFEYDVIYPTKEENLFVVHKDNIIKLYDIVTKVEYPSKVIYDTIKFLHYIFADHQVNLRVVEKFIRYELGEKKVFSSKYELTKWLSREHDIRRIAKIDKFFRRVLQKQQYGVNNSYTYEEKLLEFIYSGEGYRTRCEYFEKVFTECGKKVRFENKTEVVDFIKDESNMSFFVKNYKKICDAFKFKE